MPGALDGLRILEIAGSRTQFASMLLAGMGAEVCLVEPQNGTPLRRVGPFANRGSGERASLSFLAYNSNKKSLCLDLLQRGGRDIFCNLAAKSDVVLEAEDVGHLDGVGVGYRHCHAINPRLIWASVTPYGSRGPHSRFVGTDLSAQAMGGGMATTGEPGGRVYKAGGDVSSKMAGYTAAAALMVAISQREITGYGQHIDISAQEAVAGQMERGALFYQFTHVEPERGGRLYPTAAFPCGLFPTSDGWISLVALQPNHWDALVEWIGDERLAADRFKIGAERAAARDEIDDAICAWSRRHSKHELSAEGQKRRIAVAALQTPAEVARDPHLNAVGFFREQAVPHIGNLRIAGAPFNASLTPFRVESPAPRIGEHNEEMLAGANENLPRSTNVTSGRARRSDGKASLPLSGYRVIDLSWVIAGPACTRFLADQGAEIIKIESTKMGDPVRTFGPWLDGRNTAPEGGGAFTLLNRNKRSITLDLKRPEGVELLLRLVKQSDVVVDNFTAGTMDRLGLGYERLAGANPAIVMAQLSGFGQSGPYANRVAYGQTLLALTGHYDLIGEPGSAPLMPGYTYTDQAAGMIGAFAILAALYYRDRTGRGQHLDLSLFQIGSSLMAETLLEPLVNGTEPTRTGNNHDGAISHGAYRCAGDDRWCVIATWSTKQWRDLVAEIARDKAELAAKMEPGVQDRSSTGEIDSLIERWTVIHSPSDIMNRLQRRGIEAAIVQGPKELLESDEHLRARGFFQPFEHMPSGRTLLTEGVPYQLGDQPRAIRHGPPMLGEANDYVFHDILNLGDEEIEKLKREGITA